MTLLNTLRSRATFHPCLTSFRQSQHICTRLWTNRVLHRPQWPTQLKAPAALLRSESTASAQAKRPPFVFPEMLNVYRAGTLRTLVVGGMRMVCIVLFFVGGVLYGPMHFFSPEHSNWWIPAWLFGSAVPLVVLTLTTGPVVHAIRVRLPSRARRSREELKYFARHTPLDTILEVHCIRLSPMPRPREVVFADLRRTKPSLNVGLSNLEHIPALAKANQHTFWRWLLHRWLGRFYVEREQGKDKSAAPGLWDMMWDQIPEAGDEEVIFEARKERKPVMMANRPFQNTERAAVRPPRPAKHSR